MNGGDVVMVGIMAFAVTIAVLDALGQRQKRRKESQPK